MTTRTHTRLAAAAVALILLVAGVWWGGHPRDLPPFMRDALVAGHQNRVVSEAIDQILHDYYRPLKRSQLLDSSVGGMVASLHDRFSSYLDPRQYAAFNHSASQQFSGIGMTVELAHGGLRVVEVFDNSPAARAGIGIGDVISVANGRRLAGLPLQAATDLIKGRPGTNVRLIVSHNGRARSVTVARAEVSVPVVASRMRLPRGVKIADIALETFSAGAHGELRAAIDRLLRQGARAIVLDLRDNGGGLVEEARLVASIFLPDGPIVTTHARGESPQTLMAAGGAIPVRIPVAVLVDRNTASAAEIVAGALQDRHRATIVGYRTFGKGVFQEVQPLSNGGALDLTVGEYFLPSGRNLGGGGIQQGAGIRPDIRPGPPQGAASDRALAAALALLAARAR